MKLLKILFCPEEVLDNAEDSAVRVGGFLVHEIQDSNTIHHHYYSRFGNSFDQHQVQENTNFSQIN